MQIKKEERNGALYQMTMYSSACIAGRNTRIRSGRQKVTSEAKQKINKMHAKYRLMQYLCKNFCGGRDLFVTLTFDKIPASGCTRAVEYFHKKARAYFEARGVEYKYICVQETHDLKGVPVREHFHLILPGFWGKKMRSAILELWPYGRQVWVSTLREGGNFFEDTAEYFLKQKRDERRRAYSTSRNLEKPNAPIRTRERDTARGEVPPGAKVVRYDIKDSEFGRYEIMIAKIVDEAAFMKYWDARRKRASGQEATEEILRARHAGRRRTRRERLPQ